MTMKLVAEAIGMLAVALSGLVYLQKKRSGIIMTKLLADVMWVFNFLLQGQYTGAVINVIAVTRESVFYQRERHRWADHVAWMYGFMLLTLLSPTLEWMTLGKVTLLPLLPAAGSIISVASFFAKKPRTMRKLGCVAQILWGSYNIFIVNFSGMAAAVLMISASVIGNMREKKAEQEASDQQKAD